MTVNGAYNWLPTAINDEAIVLASSRRLAKELRDSFHEQKILAGKVAWATPPIYFWQDWLAETFEEAPWAELPTLLDTTGSGLLWEQSLDQTSRQDLLSIAGVLRHAQSAWARLQDWQVSQEVLQHSAASRDEHWFVRACAAYSERLAAGNWIDSAQLAAEFQRRLGKSGTGLPEHIMHAGFDRLTPAQQSLFEALVHHGCKVVAAPVPARQGRPKLRSYADDLSLWRAAGHWARQLKDQFPEARIAIIVPELDTQADVVGRLVREGYAPGWQLGGAAYRQSVNVSYGTRLSEFPAIAVALRALAMAAEGVSSRDVSILLRSTCFVGQNSADTARVELLLRDHPERLWTAEDLLSLMPTATDDEPEQTWRMPFTALLNLQNEKDTLQSAGSWAERIDHCLAGAGWPNTNGESSQEFQLHNRWRQLLNQLAAISGIAGDLSLSAALRHLQKLATDTLYQPEASVDGVTVMGLLESAGLEFDYLWIGGLDAAHYPQAGNPLALVNRQLQKDLKMPDAQPSDTLQFARRSLERLTTAADEICFCWSRSDGDNVQAASPLLPAADVHPVDDIADPGWYAAELLGSGQLQVLESEELVPVSSDEKIRGGAYTVQLMREEPFSAFVTGRLAAEELESFKNGLTPRMRGTLVHKALEELLRGCGGHAQLRQWDTDELGDRCEKAAYRAVSRLLRTADPVLRNLLSFEKSRLQVILSEFVQQELEREPFSIEGLEQKCKLVRGPVQLNLKIDRIDRLASGGLLLADYKTGAAKRFLDRYREPKTVQLSVYAAAIDREIDALAFINVDSREITYDGAGIGFRSGNASIADDDWAEVLSSWRTEVDSLLARFAQGEMGVNVLQPASDARPFALLSRVAELRRDG